MCLAALSTPPPPPNTLQLPGLSMVDMPGLTKVPIEGQPKSIVQVGAPFGGGQQGGRGRARQLPPPQLRRWLLPPAQPRPPPAPQELENMAREYVRHENVIILAVT